MCSRVSLSHTLGHTKCLIFPFLSRTTNVSRFEYCTCALEPPGWLCTVSTRFEFHGCPLVDLSKSGGGSNRRIIQWGGEGSRAKGGVTQVLASLLPASVIRVISRNCGHTPRLHSRTTRKDLQSCLLFPGQIYRESTVRV